MYFVRQGRHNDTENQNKSSARSRVGDYAKNSVLYVEIGQKLGENGKRLSILTHHVLSSELINLL